MMATTTTPTTTGAGAGAGAPNTSVRKEIRSAMAGVGLKGIEKDVLSKCVALASTLHMSPEQMATCWEAYSLNKKVEELTTHTFEAYKTEVYKQSEKVPSSAQSDGAIQIRNVKRQATNLVTPPASKRQQQQQQKQKGAASSIDAIARAGTSSPTAARSAASPNMNLPKYEERIKVGSVVASFNPKEWPDMVSTTPSGAARCTISSQSFDSNVRKPYRHMFTAISDRADALENQLQVMGQEIVKRYGIGNGENGIAPLEQVNVPRQETVCCVGRICNEAHEGKINAASVVLEGSSRSSGGARINVDLSHLKSEKAAYSLFPGQIVAVEGMNSTGRQLVAHRICEGAAHPPTTSGIGSLRTLQQPQDGKPLKIMSACGPFTTSDSMSYQPFVDLMHVVLEQAPDVVILAGPFVDTRQALVKAGKTTVELEDGSEQIVSHEALFANKISALISELFAAEDQLATQFVLVPSLDDATAKWVYPQPPLQDRLSRPTFLDVPGAVDIGSMGLNEINADQKIPRVHCLSNPCTFKINEVVFGVTSTDVLYHMSTEETNSHLEPGSRLRRIAQHMLQQRSFYPLFPPPPSMPTNLDLKHMEQWQIPCRPDVMIVPSKLTCFATAVLENTVVINPGHLTKGTTGGTYVMMEIQPIKRETLDESGADDVHLQHGLPDRINVEIKRI